jgi:hypothetical protein
MGEPPEAAVSMRVGFAEHLSQRRAHQRRRSVCELVSQNPEAKGGAPPTILPSASLAPTQALVAPTHATWLILPALYVYPED